jgi:hypothetical protein
MKGPLVISRGSLERSASGMALNINILKGRYIRARWHQDVWAAFQNNESQS